MSKRLFEADSVSSAAASSSGEAPFDASDVSTWALRCALGHSSDVLVPALARVELEMLLVSGAIRSKARWWDKLLDREIRTRWRRELIDVARYPHALVNFVLAELECYFVPQVDRAALITPDAVDGVFRCDELLAPAAAAKLRAALAALEANGPPDWHPGSDELVLDVVHPSLFCAVTGETPLATTDAQRWRRDNYFRSRSYRVGVLPPAFNPFPVRDAAELPSEPPTWLAEWFARHRAAHPVVAQPTPAFTFGAIPAFGAARPAVQVEPNLAEMVWAFGDALAKETDDARVVQMGAQLFAVPLAREDSLVRVRACVARAHARLGNVQAARSLLEPSLPAMMVIDFDSVSDLFPPDEVAALRARVADTDMGRFVTDDELSALRTVGGRTGEAFDVRQRAFGGWSSSKKFQWLPSEVDVGSSGNARFKSYINNLMPLHHAPMYAHLEALFGRFVPLFERVLGDLASPAHRRLPYEGLASLHKVARHKRSTVAARRRNVNRSAGGELGTAIAGADDELRKMACVHDAVAQVPAASEAAKLPLPRVVCLKNRRLQVITKIAAIHLTPDKPHYKGGSWHLEGCSDERIVATAIYYADSHNIGPSRLSFRAAVDEPSCAHSELYVHGEIFGIGNSQDLVQPRGAVDCVQGRGIVFGNCFQHCVQPFSLVDQSQAGHRRIVVFFLVDPAHRIVSTADVPPQSREWHIAVWQRTPPLNRLPRLCLELIADFAAAGTTLARAYEQRLELMADRARTVQHDNEAFVRNINLCEH